MKDYINNFITNKTYKRLDKYQYNSDAESKMIM